MKYIHHHLGLGDHILMNGLVRHFCEKFGEINLFVYHHNYENVSYMYRDNNKIYFTKVASDEDANNHVINNNLDCLRIGFSELRKICPPMTFDKAFYFLVGLNFSIRFDKFYFLRDEERELEVFKKLNPKKEKYIFVHDDPSRGFIINMNKIQTNYKIIRNDNRYKIFDYLLLLENAEEIHLMQSSFKDMINSYEMKKPTIYRHDYVRNYGEELFSLGLNHTIKVC
jgi:hypothetical protein